MTLTHSYTIEQHALRQTQNGYALTVGYLFERDANATSVEAALYSVLESGELPQRGDPHPVIPAIFCTERRAEAIDSERIRVTVEFAVPSSDDPIQRGLTRLQSGSSAAGETTAIDVAGRAIKTTFSYDVQNEETGEIETVVDVQAHSVDVERPATTALFERLEDEDALYRSMLYVGRINSAPWRRGARGTWLCTGIESDSDDGGVTYRVVYSFQFRSEGWQPIIRHVDPRTGLPVDPDILNNPGAVVQAQVYSYADFSSLNLR